MGVHSIFIALYILSGIQSEQQVKSTISFIITKTEPYCGGAAPSPEIVLRSQQQQIPYGENFYIIAGNVNTAGRKVIKRFSVDSTGVYCMRLAPGMYSVINEFSFKKLNVDSKIYDSECLKKLWETPMISYVVKKNVCDTVSYNINMHCPYNEPCKSGFGPLPM